MSLEETLPEYKYYKKQNAITHVTRETKVPFSSLYRKQHYETIVRCEEYADKKYGKENVIGICWAINEIISIRLFIFPGFLVGPVDL